MNLNKQSVLVLNRNWQAINVKSISDSLSMMYTGTATGMNIIGDDYMIPCKWEDWVKLPIEEDDDSVATTRGKILIPKIILLCEFDKVPMKRPKFTLKGIWERDNGICQYTGKKLSNNEGNIDHVIPRSRGGKTDWSNCVLSHKQVNAKKANMTPEEAGLKLIKKPSAPKHLPITLYIRNKYNIPEWEPFLKYE